MQTDQAKLCRSMQIDAFGYKVGFVFRVFASLIMCLFLSIQIAKAQDNELENIQSLIKKTQKALADAQNESERLQQTLKLAELEIAQTATQLNQTDQNLSDTRKEKIRLEDERKNISNALNKQQSLLANQLKSAYMAGNYDFAKMLFNQDDAGRFERTLTYYKYLNKARQSQITEFKGLITALEKINAELASKEVELQEVMVVQKAQSDKLRKQQQSRHVKLQQLSKQIQTDLARVESLRQEEQALVAAIEQAEIEARERALAQQNETALDVDLNGLQSLKGKLARPTVGRMQSLFGKRRQGQVRWKGVVFSSKEGVPVKSVHDGKILYADWLKGFGLVTIVDHGEGFMTVYGRNQALLKEAGQNVLAGQTIGLVGNSGGQASTGLYFELRHKGKALNPANWLTR